ncbi:MAG TPA: glycosyltransferase [Bacteroidales bacterium]|jgi:glycosyltransferase involved in cell wall biosynthesis|nr:glycosyltransferase [Bacteroidales bacterium]
MKVKIGIYLETPYCRFEDNSIGCLDIYTNLFNEFPKEAFDLHFLGRIESDKGRYYYPFKLPVTFHQVSYYKTLIHIILIYPFYLLKNHKTISDFVDQCDRLLIMTSSPIANYVLHIAGKKRKTCFLLVRHDSITTIPNKYKGVKKILAKIMATHLERKAEKFAKKNQPVVFALGEDRYNHYLSLSSKTILFSSSKYSVTDVIADDQIKNINWYDTVKLLFVGRFEVDKGVYELLAAVKSLSEYNISLTFLGSGSCQNSIELIIKSNNLNNKIKIAGYIPYGPELLNEYSKHDILILPSYCEGLPQVILESMAKGCLVIATKVGGIPSIIEDGYNGFLIQPFKVDSISNVIKKLVLEKPDVTDIKKAGRNTALKYAKENQQKVLFNNLLS